MTEVERDFSPAVARALDGYARPPEGEADWHDVLRRTGRAPENASRRRRWFAPAAAVAVAVTLSLATPLGGAIRDRVGDFSAWLRGTPGEPVAAEEQRAFDEQNARSYAAFPGSPQLRRLIRTEVDGVTYDLLGFRSAGSLCVRLVATGSADGSTTACAPVADLRTDDAPARVLLADWPVGKGEKTATIGFDTYRAPWARVTAGIAADGVERVELADDSGSHRVDVTANSFLYVAARPDVDQHVTHARAWLSGGRTVGVPFTPAAWGPGGGFGGSAGEPGGPTRVEHDVRGGTIGWLDRREERGEPLDSVPETLHAGKAEFGRVIEPDPASGKRIAVTISRLRMGSHDGARSVCYALITREGASGGCAGKPGELFKDVPFATSSSVMGAGAQYATFSGIASDEVARLELFTATGNRVDVALRDNAFLAEVALVRMPAKLVAYDAEGRVIGIRETPRREGPQTPTGDPIVRLSERADGSSLELIAYRTKQGGQCWFGRGTGKARVNMGGCVAKDWRYAPVRIATIPEPPLFLYGHVRDDVKRVTVRYADGEELEIEPGRHGYVLLVVPEEHRRAAKRVVEFIGLGARNEVVARVRIPPRSG